ncbi:MAG: M48 family metallopeptidase [Oscillospiraceae bacterium]
MSAVRRWPCASGRRCGRDGAADRPQPPEDAGAAGPADGRDRCPRALRLPERDIHAFAEQHAAWLEAAVARARAGSRAAQRAGILSEAELQRLRTAAQADLTERVTRLAARMGVDFAGITIRAQRTRWGSCSARGSLSFNCLLMLAPPEVREYVAVHELCHRKQMNHSAAFWREVASCLPDYAAQRAWLREHGPALLGRLPET